MSAKQIPLLLCLLLLLCLPSVKTQAADEANQGRQEYVVCKGDTLYSIAHANNMSADLLAALNNLDPNAILRIGTKIWLPQDPGQQVIIEKGDTLWQLAKDYGVSLSELINYNQISEPEKLKIGQVILIPVSSDEPILPAAAPAEPSPDKDRFTTASRSGTGATGFIWPLKGVITSIFGQGKNRYHHGLDIAASAGTTIGAAKAGKVIQAGWRNDVYGRTVLIDHGNNQQTLYAHASKVLVKAGDYVEAGQAIAEVGATGNATGAHLHFEVHIGDTAVDPQKYLR